RPASVWSWPGTPPAAPRSSRRPTGPCTGRSAAAAARSNSSHPRRSSASTAPSPTLCSHRMKRRQEWAGVGHHEAAAAPNRSREGHVHGAGRRASARRGRGLQPEKEDFRPFPGTTAARWAYLERRPGMGGGSLTVSPLPRGEGRRQRGGHMPGNDVLLGLHRQMVRIRLFEETLVQVYMEGKTPAFDIAAGPVPGEMHLAAGQEPVAAGVCAHLRPSDAVTATHRPHHIALAHGVDMRKMAAEIFGKSTGLGGGKGGHMHLFDPSTNFGCSGIIGEGIPTAVGFALAFKRQGRDDVAVAVFGEGAANQGSFHESLNLAALWHLPAVFVCEDNTWAISVPKDHST